MVRAPAGWRLRPYSYAAVARVATACVWLCCRDSSMLPILLLLLSGNTAQAAVTHSLGQPSVGDVGAAASCSDNPPFLSYHVHVLFWQTNQSSVANALKLYRDFARAHSHDGAPLLPNCTADGSALIYPGEGEGPSMKMCFGGMAMAPVGPFLTGQLFWAVGLDEFGAALAWLMRAHGSYPLVDVFVHPVTGCDAQVRTHLLMMPFAPPPLQHNSFLQLSFPHSLYSGRWGRLDHWSEG
jgi:aromatic ring-cleaving dioxygenase